MTTPYALGDDRDPPTEVMALREDATRAGSAGTLHLHHLHGLLTALAPLQAAYTSAAVDRLRALPLEARRAIFPHLLEEHPHLLCEPRVRALADEVLLDAEAACDRPDVVRWLARVSGGVRAQSASDALTRVEHALAALACGLAEALRACAEPSVTPARALPDDASELLARLLREDPDRGATEVAQASAAIAGHAAALRSAARDAASALVARVDLQAIEAAAKLPRWWPAPFRDAALWTRALAAQREAGRNVERHFDDLFTRAYLSRVQANRG